LFLDEEKKEVSEDVVQKENLEPEPIARRTRDKSKTVKKVRINK